VNTDALINIADVIYFLGHLFPAPGSLPNTLLCREAANVNDDAQLDIGDAIFQLETLFPSGGGMPPVIPPPNSCGIDPQNTLGCDSFPPCP